MGLQNVRLTSVESASACNSGHVIDSVQLNYCIYVRWWIADIDWFLRLPVVHVAKFNSLTACAAESGLWSYIMSRNIIAIARECRARARGIRK